MLSKNFKIHLGGVIFTLVVALVGLAIFNVSTGLAVGDVATPSDGNLKSDRSITLIQADNFNNLNTIDGPALVIPAADFRSDGFFPDSVFFDFDTGTWEGRATGDGCMIAPAYLPDDVTVTSILASFIDNDENNHINFDLIRVNMSSGSVGDMAYMNTVNYFSSPDVDTVSTTNISNPLVDYPTYSYYLSTCLPTVDTKLVGIQIDFTH
jgi:hypothetical protein